MSKKKSWFVKTNISKLIKDCSIYGFINRGFIHDFSPFFLQIDITCPFEYMPSEREMILETQMETPIMTLWK